MRSEIRSDDEHTEPNGGRVPSLPPVSLPYREDDLTTEESATQETDTLEPAPSRFTATPRLAPVRAARPEPGLPLAAVVAAVFVIAMVAVAAAAMVASAVIWFL